MTRITVLPAIAVCAALALAGCGSSTKGATATTAAATSAPATSVADTSAPATGAADTTPAGGSVQQPTGPHANEPFCTIQAQLNAEPSPFDNVTSGSLPSAADVEKYFTVQVPAGVAKLRAVVPAELKADFETVVTILGTTAELLKKHNWDFQAASTDNDFQATFANADFRAASDRLDAYCGLSSN